MVANMQYSSGSAMGALTHAMSQNSGAQKSKVGPLMRTADPSGLIGIDLSSHIPSGELT